MGRKALPKRAEPRTAAAQKAGLKKTGLKKAGVKKAGLKKAGVKAGNPQAAAQGAGIEQRAPQAAPSTAATSNAAVLDRLHAVVLDRRTANPAQSHSARLLARGLPKVAQKFGEEAVECLIEAVGGNTDALVAESADVLYHLIVMWVAAGVAPDQVWTELARREGISGVAEKAARPRTDLGTTKIP